MARRTQKRAFILRIKGNEQGEDYNEAECEICHERAKNPSRPLEPIPCQHALCVSGQGELVSGHGLPERG